MMLALRDENSQGRDFLFLGAHEPFARAPVDSESSSFFIRRRLKLSLAPVAG